jgi:quinol monooxygenase YgiN/mannose-6-phosphate isomerase-like protein (cupin superfamily)
MADGLLAAASLVADAPGCELWLVSRDRSDADTVRAIERWASSEQCDAALEAERVAGNAERVMGLLAEPPQVVDGDPIGGVRETRGTTGATRFSILDAPDLSHDSDLLGEYGLDSVGEARYVRAELGAVQTGLTHYRLRPGRRLGWAHRHAVAEETYVATGGSGRIKVDAELLELVPLDAVRVAPASVRELEAGPEGLEVLAFGSHSPGDGEFVADWWPA